VSGVTQLWSRVLSEIIGSKEYMMDVIVADLEGKEAIVDLDKI